MLANGATGTAGRLAVRIAKHLGRGRSLQLVAMPIPCIRSQPLVRMATVPGDFKIAVKPVPLSEVEQAWPKDDSTRRTVFTINEQKSSGQSALNSNPS